MRFVMFGATIVPAFTLALLFLEKRSFRISAEQFWTGVVVGASVAFPIIAIVAFLIEPNTTFADIYIDAIAKAFLEAAIPEELCKFAVIMVLFFRASQIAPPTDIIIAGVAVSLGFAAFENLGYLMESIRWQTTALIRSLTAIPGHIYVGAIMGALIARSRDAGNKILCWALAIVLPVGLHGLYDTFAFLRDAVGETPGKSNDRLRAVTEYGFVLTVIGEGIIAHRLAASAMSVDDDSIVAEGINEGGVFSRYWISQTKFRTVFWGTLSGALVFFGIATILNSQFSIIGPTLLRQLGDFSTSTPVVIGIGIFMIFHGLLFFSHFLSLSRKRR